MGTGGDTLATVYIPSLMQKLTDGKSKVQVGGSTVRQIVENLEKDYPGMRDRLVDENRIKGNISVAIDGEITTMGMLGKVDESSEVHFLPAIGGG
jgi:molybdopterin synthase sulfur carrier subunit